MKSKFLPFYGYRLSIALLCLCSSPNLLLANTLEKDLATIDQNKITLSGTVSDESGPLPGVIVQIKSRNNATLSDHDGNYSIQVNQGDTVEFSYMGYITKNVTINNQENLNITLQQDSQQLDEIVVNAGYYTVKDREKTGSIARVTAKDIEHQPVINPLQAIQGRMAGVDITQGSGVPGSAINIEIRGRNSLRPYQNNAINGNAPLYVIDGLVLPTSNMLNSTISMSILPLSDTNILNSISPSDIESIEILKDADATAIYGSRGANGVILITTKKNKSNRLKASVTSTISFSKVANKIKLLDTKQFNKIRDLAFSNDQISDFPHQALDMNGTWDRNRYTDWQELLIGGTSKNMTQQASLSGGNQYTTFLASYNYNEQTTVFPTDKGYKRNTLLINFNHQSKDGRLFFNSTTNYSLQSNNLLANDLTSFALTLPPNAPSLYNEDGTLNWGFPNDKNPIASIAETYSNNTNNLILKVDTEYSIYKDIKAKLNVGYNTNNMEERRITPHTIYHPDLNYTSSNSSSQYIEKKFKTFTIEPQISFDKKINDKLLLSSVSGLTYQKNESNSIYLSGSDFQTNDFITNIGAAKNKGVGQTDELQYKYLALFTRINFKYENKYFINLTARRDGSSRFGEKQKFGNFGAIGIAWVFTNENFLTNNKIINFGKIRSSYGTSGSDNIGDYQYLDTYQLNFYNYDNVPGLYPSRLHNPYFSWEETKKFEFAIETSFLNNRIYLDLAWYRNTSANQLVGLTLPGTTGFPSIQDNLPATVENKGWEINLTTKNIDKKDLKWTTSFNISIPRNKLIKFPNLSSSTYANTFIVGQSTKVLKLLNYEGINNETGRYSFTDYDIDGTINKTTDNKAIVEIEKDFHGGISNSISYKNLHLDFLFQFVKQVNYNFNRNLAIPGALTNFPIEVLDNWSLNQLNPKYSQITSGANTTLVSDFNNFKQSNAIIGDASYIRLKNISLSYILHFPKFNNATAKFYIQGHNILTFTKYFGLDPEFITTGFLPPLKTYAFGVQINF